MNRKIISSLLLLLYPAIISASWLDATIKFKKKVRVNTDSTGAQYHPLMVRDKYLNFYVVWEDDRDGDGNYEIYYSRSTDTGKTFEPEINLSQNPTMNNKYPWIAIDESSRVYVVWQALRADGFWDIYFTRSEPFGVNFKTPEPAKGVIVNNNQDSEVNFGPQPKIFVDDFSSDTTFLYLVWADGAGTTPTKILLARSISLGDTFETTGVEVSHGTGVCRHPAITVDDSGRILCVFESGSGINTDPHPNIAFAYSIDRGKTFMGDILVNDDPEASHRRLHPVLTFRANKVFVVWEDSRQPPAQADDKPYLFMAHWKFGDTAFSENIQVNYGSDVENYRPAISIDPTGLMVVTWHSGNSTDGIFSIYVAGYSDTLNQFSSSRKFGETNTGNSGANFGNMFYPPCIVVDSFGGVTRFFMCWQDYSDDPDGDIFFVEGYVTITLADVDFFPDSLDADTGVVCFENPPLEEWTSKLALLINTDSITNPDTMDGPSNTRVYLSIDTCYLSSKNSSILLKAVLTKDSLEIGECCVCTLKIKPSKNIAGGLYKGLLVVKAIDPDTIYEDFDSIKIAVNIVRGDIDFFDDSLDVDTGVMFFNKPYIGKWNSKNALIINTDDNVNPDTSDGPSNSQVYVWVDTCYLKYEGKVKKKHLEKSTTKIPIEAILAKDILEIGESSVCTVKLNPPKNVLGGLYSGILVIKAIDPDSNYEESDSIKIVAYIVRGDIDFFDDSLDADTGVVYFNSPYANEWTNKYAMFMNTDATANPDTFDGPSNSMLYVEVDTCYLQHVKSNKEIPIEASLSRDSINIGEICICTIRINPPATADVGLYKGLLIIKACDPDTTYEDFDTLKIVANITRGDFDFFNNLLDASNDTVKLNAPPSEQWVYRKILYINSSDESNPDADDGPGNETIISLKVETSYVSLGDKVYFVHYSLRNCTLKVGEKDTCNLWIKLPDEATYGVYSGKIVVKAIDERHYESKDSVFLVITAPCPRTTLKSAYVYPNPFRLSSGHKYMCFTNLTEDAKIIIVDESGHIVKRLRAGKDGGCRFEPDLPSGVYFYYIYDSKGNRICGKFAIIK